MVSHHSLSAPRGLRHVLPLPASLPELPCLVPQHASPLALAPSPLCFELIVKNETEISAGAIGTSESDVE